MDKNISTIELTLSNTKNVLLTLILFIDRKLLFSVSKYRSCIKNVLFFIIVKLYHFGSDSVADTNLTDT